MDLNIHIKIWVLSKLNRNFFQVFFFLKGEQFPGSQKLPKPCCSLPVNLMSELVSLSGQLQSSQHPWPWGKSTRCIRSGARGLCTLCFSCPGRDLPGVQVGFLKLSSSGVGKSPLCSAQFQQNKPGLRNDVSWEHFRPAQFSGINCQRRNSLAEGAFSSQGYLIHLQPDFPLRSVQSQGSFLVGAGCQQIQLHMGMTRPRPPHQR